MEIGVRPFVRPGEIDRAGVREWRKIIEEVDAQRITWVDLPGIARHHTIIGVGLHRVTGAHVDGGRFGGQREGQLAIGAAEHLRLRNLDGRDDRCGLSPEDGRRLRPGRSEVDQERPRTGRMQTGPQHLAA